MGRATKDKRDIYYRKAKEDGYRARSAYKLLQIDDSYHIFRGVTRAVDLCAAPGSWSQVLATRLPENISVQTALTTDADAVVDAPSTSSAAAEAELAQPRIVAVDLQDMAPIPGVTIIQGDITTEDTATRIVRLLDGRAQLVVCDGAPDVTGLHELDEYVQHQLLVAALNISTFVLAPGGTFVAKIFRGPNTPFLIAKLQVFFQHVVVVKPTSSRHASMEAFILGQGYAPPAGFAPFMIDPVHGVDPRSVPQGSTNASVAPFLACGSVEGFDSDMAFATAEVHRQHRHSASGVEATLTSNPFRAACVDLANAVRRRELEALPTVS